jgi:hypothetical protein
MRTAKLALPIAPLLLTFLACGGGEKKAVEPPAPAAPVEAKVVFGAGFFNLEQAANGASWRWMSEEGVVKLQNVKRVMTLKLATRAPLERFPQSPTVRFEINGTLLEEIVLTTADLNKEYEVSVEQQGPTEWSELRIKTNRSFVPKEVMKDSNDARKLGLMLNSLTWVAKP